MKSCTETASAVKKANLYAGAFHRGAGTDANVFIEMHGSKGSMGETRLDNAHNNFERNMKDAFTIKASDLGDIHTIIIRHDNSGIGSAWHLQQVGEGKSARLGWDSRDGGFLSSHCLLPYSAWVKRHSSGCQLHMIACRKRRVQSEYIVH